MKPARIGSWQPYHQDQPLGFHVDPPDMVTCWAPMDRATVENGCLWVLPGTHRAGVIPREKWLEYEGEAVAGKLSRERPLELEIGDCSFHHGLLLHSSRANSSPERRRGYATHYVSSHCRYTAPSGKSDALLMRGQSIPGCIYIVQRSGNPLPSGPPMHPGSTPALWQLISAPLRALKPWR